MKKAVKFTAAVLIAAALLQSCSGVILPRKGCPTNQGLIGYH